ncbi:MAG TPA: SpoIID/LytB domain-containing protein [Ignavibacteriales bacterium]|nr:SpoIID/LytB domain-containing protein [Ignavibacteriales bacterium]
MKFLIIFLCIIWNTIFSQNQLNLNYNSKIRVRIIYSLKEIKFQPITKTYLLNSQNQCYLLDTLSYKFIVKDDSLHLYDDKNNLLTSSTEFKIDNQELENKVKIYNVPYGIGWWWQNKQDRIYEGLLTFSINKNKKIDVINIIPIENYICGVIPSEIGVDAPFEALKAQAVAARSETFVALYKGLYRGNNYDICSDVECQVFTGTTLRTPITDSAVYQTKGIALFDSNNVPINGYFASNCGGMSENIENAWSERPKNGNIYTHKIDSDSLYDINLQDEKVLRNWLTNPPKTFCNPQIRKLPKWSSNYFRWTLKIPKDSLNKWLKFKLDTIKIIKRGYSGRITEAHFIGKQDTLKVNSELKFRQIFKPPLRSSCCIIDYEENELIISGAGWGHGVGMCQSGAIGRALEGENFINILKHYYNNAKILKLY